MKCDGYEKLNVVHYMIERNSSIKSRSKLYIPLSAILNLFSHIGFKSVIFKSKIQNNLCITMKIFTQFHNPNSIWQSKLHKNECILNMYSNIHKLIDFYVIFLRYPKENNMLQIQVHAYSSINETQISEKTTLQSSQEQKS